MSKYGDTFKKLAFAAAALVIFVFLLEGACSITLVLYEAVFWSRAPMADRAHTQHDAELGWVAVPGLHIKDLYGPGASVTTNSQGFRNKHDFDVEPPPSKLRVICSGDSFTLGYGVDDEQTWCRQLELIDTRLETVNMGQGGYGIDQAYLWYKRNGAVLEHGVQIFSFITDDFNRMRKSRFWGYDKPLLGIENGELTVYNTPVPKRSFMAPWLTENAQLFQKINMFQLIGKFISGIGLGRPGVSRIDQTKAFSVVSKIFADLREINNKKGSTLVVVYLPFEKDYHSKESEIWREYLHKELPSLGIVFIDLVEEFCKLPYDQFKPLYLRPEDLSFPGAAGHFSAAGNRYCAEVLHKKLIKLPGVAAKLNALPVEQP